jgi:hypothetical protein
MVFLLCIGFFPWRDRPKTGAVLVDLIAASCWGAVMAATMMGKKPALYTHNSN